MSIAYLKVKICSLAFEGAYIHRQEHRWKKRWRSHGDQTFFGLRSHPTWDVRTEQRAALLAYGYLRGRSYRTMEFKCNEPPNWSRVAELVRKYGPPGTKEAIALSLKAWHEVETAKQAA